MRNVSKPCEVPDGLAFMFNTPLSQDNSDQARTYIPSEGGFRGSVFSRASWRYMKYDDDVVVMQFQTIRAFASEAQ